MSFNSFFDPSYIRNTSFYQFLSNTGESIHFYAGRVKDAESTGKLYEAIPLIGGSYLLYTGLKNIFRGTVGYDSLAMRTKMAKKAFSDSKLNYSQKFSLINTSIFGSMKGKQRATILAKSITQFALASLLIYPLLRLNTAPDLDLAVATSAPNARDGLVTSSVWGNKRENELITAMRLYFTDGYGAKLAIYNPQMSPNTLKFIEQILNPNNITTAQSINNSLNNMAAKTCHATLGWTRYTQQCPSLIEPHTSLFSTNPDGVTLTNTTHLKNVCQNIQTEITNLKPSLETQTAQLFQSICNYTLGFTPLAKKCDTLTTFAPKESDVKEALSTFATTLCGDLNQRVNNEPHYVHLFNQSAIAHDQYHAIGALDSQTLTFANTTTDKPQTALGLLGTQHPNKFTELTRVNLNISQSTPLTPDSIKKAFKTNAITTHPDHNGEGAADQFGATKAIKNTFAANPNLYTGSSRMSVTDFFSRIFNYFRRPSDS